MTYLFPDFLRDQREFGSAVLYWQRLCETILSNADQRGAWKIWFNEYPNRQLVDIFPIYSLLNQEGTKGLVVNQRDPKVHAKAGIELWMEDTEEFLENGELVEGVPLYFMVFNCNLTDQTSKVFEDLFSIWIQPEVTKADMEKVLDKSL